MGTKKHIVYANRPWEATGICSGCKLCELYCSLRHNGSFNPHRSRIKVIEVATGIDIPVTCLQCQDPPCLAACRFEAIVHDEGLKIARVIEEKCTGCKECLGACPHGSILMDPVTKKALKCDLCGEEEPACVAYCPSSVLRAMDDEEASEYSRRRRAALLAYDDELRRSRPSGEDQIMKKLEVRSQS